MSSLGKTNSIAAMSSSVTKTAARLCTPATIYLCFSLAVFTYGCIYYSQTVLSIIFQLLYLGFITWLLNFICKQGYPGISWFILFLPIIITLVGLILGFSVISREIMGMYSY